MKLSWIFYIYFEVCQAAIVNVDKIPDSDRAIDLLSLPAH